MMLVSAFARSLHAPCPDGSGRVLYIVHEWCNLGIAPRVPLILRIGFEMISNKHFTRVLDSDFLGSFFLFIYLCTVKASEVRGGSSRQAMLDRGAATHSPAVRPRDG